VSKEHIEVEEEAAQILSTHPLTLIGPTQIPLAHPQLTLDFQSNNPVMNSTSHFPKSFLALLPLPPYLHLLRGCLVEFSCSKLGS